MRMPTKKYTKTNKRVYRRNRHGNFKRKGLLPHPDTDEGFFYRFGMTIVAFFISITVLGYFGGAFDTPANASGPAGLPIAEEVEPDYMDGVEIVEVKDPIDPNKVLHGENGLPSQEQKDIVAAEVIDAAARHHLNEKHKTDLYLTILAMTRHESGFNCAAAGDRLDGTNPVSHGCLQIRVDIRPVTVQQAQDFRFAVKWTIDRMMHYGWKDHPTYAVSKHNGSGPMAQKYAEAVNSTIHRFRQIGL